MEISAQQLSSIVQELRAPKLSGTEADKRRSPRAKVDQTEVITLCRAKSQPTGRNQSQATTVTIRNISWRGVSIIYHQTLSVGDLFQITFSSTTHSPIVLLCTVGHCRRMTEHQYAIGAEFTRIGTGPADFADDSTFKCIEPAIAS